MKKTVDFHVERFQENNVRGHACRTVILLLNIVIIVVAGAFAALLQLQYTDVALADESTVTDLIDYAQSKNASVNIKVTDSQNTEIEQDGNGDYVLTKGESYSIKLDFRFESGMDPGTYVYTFPAGVTLLNDSSGTVTSEGSSGSIDLGTWSLDKDTGTLTFIITDAVKGDGNTGISHITLSASAAVSFDEAGDEIQIGEITYKVIADTKDETVSLHKRAVSIDVDNDKIFWEIEIDGGSDVGLAGQTITDALVKGGHEFTDDDAAEMGITIQDENGDYHSLPSDDAGLTQTADGWQITLPDSFNCASTGCGKTITLPAEDSTGWVVYIEYTTTITSSGADYVTYSNKVIFDDLEKSAEIVTGGGDIDKSGVYNAGTDWEDTTVTWTVDVMIPGAADGEDKVNRWHIYDSMGVYIDSQRQQRYYNDLGVDKNTTVITAKIGGGEEISVPNIEDAKGGEDLIAWELHATANSEDDGSGYDYGRTIWLYTWDSENSEWSLWWNIKSDTVLTVTYSSDVVYDMDGDGVIEDTDENLIEKYNVTGALLRNSVGLKNKGTTGKEDNTVQEASAEVELPAMLDKVLTGIPDNSNRWIAEFTVDFNETMMDLSGYDEVVLTDAMSKTLVFQKDSVVITAEDADGERHAVSDYSVAYDSSGTDSNVATITLNKAALGPYRYTLVYNASISSTGGGNVSYSNDIEVTICGKGFKSSIGTKTADNVTSSYQQYSVTLQKADSENSEVLLAGAEFDVYNAETEALLTSVATGDNGIARVATNPDNGVILYAHKLYYFIETEAPEGYQLDNTTKHYFWFCNNKGECSECEKLAESLKKTEGDDVKAHDGAFDSAGTEEYVEITVTNTPMPDKETPGIPDGGSPTDPTPGSTPELSTGGLDSNDSTDGINSIPGLTSGGVGSAAGLASGIAGKTCATQTGDDVTLILWIAIMLAAATCACGAVICVRKKKHSER